MNKRNRLRIELEAIQRKHPKRLLLVEAVHKWAKANPSSALHKEIEWDTTKAARKYQFLQIRNIIALNITSEDGTPKIISLSIDRTNVGGGYRSISDVIKDKQLSKIMLGDAINEMERLRVKYRYVAELSSVWKELDKIAKSFEQKFSVAA